MNKYLVTIDVLKHCSRCFSSANPGESNLLGSFQIVVQCPDKSSAEELGLSVTKALSTSKDSVDHKMFEVRSVDLVGVEYNGLTVVGHWSI